MTDNPVIEANPCKLRNGNWGCKTAEPVETGATVRIVTRANKQWRARITDVVWTDGTVCICETESEDQRAPVKEPEDRPAPPLQTGTKTPARPPSRSSERASTPPDSSGAPNNDLDAMADRAAAMSNEEDDWLSAYDELERGG